jgi:hypothetical protein
MRLRSFEHGLGCFHTGFVELGTRLVTPITAGRLGRCLAGHDGTGHCQREGEKSAHDQAPDADVSVTPASRDAPVSGAFEQRPFGSFRVFE